MYREEVFEIWAMVEIWNILYLESVKLLVNQNLQKDLARKINIRNGKSKNFVYTAPTAKTCGRTYDFIDSECKAQDVTIFDDIDATCLDFKVSKCFW